MAKAAGHESKAEASDSSCPSSTLSTDTLSISSDQYFWDSDTLPSETEDFPYIQDLKPLLPYVEGARFTVLKHDPPEPFGYGYPSGQVPAMATEWQTLSQLQLCLAQPPAPGITYSDQKLELEVASIIRTGTMHGAQLVVVSNGMVAKIYDPLYYPAYNDLSHKNNVVSMADEDYSRECTAYQALQKDKLAKKVTPAFYGSWTTEIETVYHDADHSSKHVRSVRMILMERLDGQPMSFMSPGHIQKPLRSRILKKALEAEALISAAGIQHKDFCPRHVHIIGKGFYDPDIPPSAVRIRIKIFDFDMSEVISHPNSSTYPRYAKLMASWGPWLPRIRSPILRHFGSIDVFAQEGWCSNKEEEAAKWLWLHFRDDPRYIPVKWDPESPSEWPQMVNYEHREGEKIKTPHDTFK